MDAIIIIVSELSNRIWSCIIFGSMDTEHWI